MLGFEVAQSTVSKYMARPSKPPSQTWKTFLRNHAEAIAAIAVGEILKISQIPYCKRTVLSTSWLGHHRAPAIILECLLR